jgi:CMP-N,N'-diacetyllegionaminic acid synthase
MQNNQYQNNYIIILARGGSTRIKNKNLKKINGISLVLQKIKDAKKANIGKVFLSTNSSKIKYIGYKNNILVIDRPQNYSSAKATTFSSILNFLRILKKKKYMLPKYLTILPPTYPFLKVSTIKKCYKKMIKAQKFDSISAYTKSNVHPFTMIIKKKDQLFFDKIRFLNFKPKNFERTQDWPEIFNNSAAIRITKVKYFLPFIKNKSSKLVNFTFNKRSSIGFEITKKEAFDINNSHDLSKARKIKNK